MKIEFKGIKGEWMIAENHIHEQDHYHYTILSNGSKCIAEVWRTCFKGQSNSGKYTDSGSLCEDAQAFDNARLISAAPDLLNALGKCIEIVKVWHGEDGFDIYLNKSPEFEPIRETLKKAGVL